MEIKTRALVSLLTLILSIQVILKTQMRPVTTPPVSGESDCANGEDDDGDGLVDCLDEDCDGEVSVDFDGKTGFCEFGEETNYEDGFDNNGNEETDCDDEDCADVEICMPDVEDCRDGVDNDGDGFVDCADSDCDGEVSVDSLGNAGFCEVVEQSCDDDFDNDGDGDVDCADSNCPECASEDCTAVGDEDGNGLADCADGCTISIDAFGNTGFCEAVEQSCDDNFDNDGDGLVDCFRLRLSCLCFQ